MIFGDRAVLGTIHPKPPAVTAHGVTHKSTTAFGQDECQAIIKVGGPAMAAGLISVPGPVHVVHRVMLSSYIALATSAVTAADVSLALVEAMATC